MKPEVMIMYAVAVLLSLTVHEVAHGFAAWKKGDNTAKDDGRLSLNPLKHLDLLGTISFVITFVYFRVPFGWAKPVPVNVMNLDNPRKDMSLVAFAGPFSNMVFALIAGYLLIIMSGSGTEMNPFVYGFLYLLVRVNIGLSFFNLLPIPPLDGSNILRGLLPPDKLMAYIRFTQQAPKIFIFMMIAEHILRIPILSLVLKPLLTPYLYIWGTIVFQGKIPI